MRQRRQWLLGAALGGLLGGLPPAPAQATGKVARLGWLRPNTPGPSDWQSLGSPAALRRQGWVEGQNLVNECVASCIDRVLRGARTGELPIEQPARFGLAINQGMPKAIGLSLPRARVLRSLELIA